MKRILILVANVFIMAFATAVFANGAVVTQPKANSGFYAGIKAGYAVLSSINKDEEITSTIQIYSPKNGSFAWGMFLGYQYAFTNNLLAGLELGYNDNGSSSLKANINGGKVTNHVESKDINLLAVTRYIWNNGVNIFAKGGIARVEQRDHISTGRAEPAALITRYVPEVDAGIGYQFLQHWNAYLEYRHIFAQNQHNYANTYKNQGLKFKGVATLNAGYLGIAYLF